MIRLNGIHMHHGDFSLDNFSLEAREGEYYVLLGPSGVGKSTVLETIAGFHTPLRGSVEINGIDVTHKPPEKRGVGYVPQGAVLFPHLTGLENILFGPRALGRSGAAHEKRLSFLVDMLEIRPVLNRYPAAMSGGERQRIAIARGLAAGPSVVLFDEPLSSIDAPAKRSIMRAIKNIHRETGATFLHVTHDQDEAFSLGSVISLMFSGGIEQTGKRNRIYFFPKTVNVAVFTGMRNIYRGVVTEVLEDSRRTVIMLDGNRLTADIPEFQSLPEIGADIHFGIRPEEVMILREERVIKPSLKENILCGNITDIQERSATHTIFFSDESGVLNMEIDLPNTSYRKLKLAAGGTIRVSLRSASIWMVPVEKN